MSGGGREFLDHSNIETVLNKRQPGDSPRKTNHQVIIYIKGTKVLDHFGSSILVTPHASVNVVKILIN